MSVQVHREARQAPVQPEQAIRQERPVDRWAGTPLAVEHWLESPSGFPVGGVGTNPLSPATAVVTTARGQSLSRRQLDEVLAFAEFLAGRAVPDDDRAELTDDIVDAFEDSPKSAARFLRQLAGGVRRISSLDPLERCQRRLAALVTTYTIELRRQADGAEPTPIMEVVARYNPVVRHRAATGVVLVADALAARVDQHRLVLSLIERQAEEPAALRQRLLDGVADAEQMEIAELVAAELRLLSVRAWLRDLGDSALMRLRKELARAVSSALDVDVVVQQVGFRAALAQAGTRTR